MAQPTAPPRTKLICGMISSRPGLLDEAAVDLANTFGPLELIGPDVPFDFTHYYDAEMGSPLWRRFVSFALPFDPGDLADAKLRTNAVEADCARRVGAALGLARPVNLDVGYVEPAKLILASMKNFSHRIYLGRGVYAEVTLQYAAGRWQALPWTFRDYASGRYDEFLTAVRDGLRRAPAPEEGGG